MNITDAPIILQIQENQYPIIEEVKKQRVILAIDPAFKKCGVGLILSGDGSYVDSMQIPLRPDGKLIQAQVDGYIARSIKNIMTTLLEQYDVSHIVIELQLGQFSCDRVQLAFVCEIPDNIPFTVQHSKLKLKHPEIKNSPADNLESNKYNQNKHQGRDLANKLFPDISKLTFDESDALLHGLYAYRNMNKIVWVKKSDLK